MKNLPKVKLNQVRVGSDIAQVPRLVPKKSYLIIIGPNSYEKLGKSVIMSSWS